MVVVMVVTSRVAMEVVHVPLALMMTLTLSQAVGLWNQRPVVPVATGRLAADI